MSFVIASQVGLLRAKVKAGFCGGTPQQYWFRGRIRCKIRFRSRAHTPAVISPESRDLTSSGQTSRITKS